MQFTEPLITARHLPSSRSPRCSAAAFGAFFFLSRCYLRRRFLSSIGIFSHCRTGSFSSQLGFKHFMFHPEGFFFHSFAFFDGFSASAYCDLNRSYVLSFPSSSCRSSVLRDLDSQMNLTWVLSHDATCCLCFRWMFLHHRRMSQCQCRSAWPRRRNACSSSSVVLSSTAYGTLPFLWA